MPVRIETSSSTQRFPDPSALLNLGPFHQLEQFARAPWFPPHLILNETLINQYAISSVLPGRVPVRTPTFPEWDLRFVLRPRFLLRCRGETDEVARCDNITLLHKCLRPVYNDCVVPACLRFDERVYRSFGESHYGEALSECDAYEWRGKRDVHADALLFQRSI